MAVNKVFLEMTLNKLFSQPQISRELAKLLNTNPEEIQIVATRSSKSMSHFWLWLLPHIANALISLVESQRPEIKELGIERVKAMDAPNASAPSNETPQNYEQNLAEPLAQRISYHDFDGWLTRRRVAVPPNHQGLVIRHGIATQQYLPPGHPVALKPTDILFGNPPSIEAAIFRTSPVTIPLMLDAMLTADGDLIDVWAQVTFYIADAEKFYASFLQYRRKISVWQTLRLLLSKDKLGFENHIRQITVHQRPSSVVLADLGDILNRILEPSADAAGLHIASVQNVSLWRVDDRKDRVANFLKLKRDLLQIYIDDAVDQSEKFVIMHDMLWQLERDYDFEDGALTDVLQRTYQPDLPPKEIFQRIAQLLDRVTAEATKSRHQRFYWRLQPEEERAVPPPQAPESLASIMRKFFGWGSLIPVVAIAIQIYKAWAEQSFGIGFIIYITLLIGVFVFMWIIAFSLDRRSSVRRETWLEHHLTDLAQGDLSATDQLARQNLAQTLTVVDDMLQNARQTLFGADLKDVALQLANLQMQHIRPLQATAQNNQRGQALYTQIDIQDPTRLKRLLDRDEALLQQAEALRNESAIFQKISGQTDTQYDPLIQSLRDKLIDLNNSFEKRGALVN